MQRIGEAKCETKALIRDSPATSMVREYALERLEASGEAEALRRQHAAYYLALAEAADPAIRGPEQAVWLRRLETEHDNLRAALAWSQSAVEGTELGLRLVAALSWFWYLRGYFGEWDRWLTAALARLAAATAAGEVASGSPHYADLQRTRANALVWRGVRALNQGDWAAAHTLGAELLALARDLSDRRGTAAACCFLAWPNFRQYGHRALAQAQFQEGVARAREAGDPWLLAWGLAQHGFQMLGEPFFQTSEQHLRQAVVLLDESLTLARGVGDPWLVAWSLHNRGWAALWGSDLPYARMLMEESLAIRRHLGDRHGIALSLQQVGALAARQDDLEAARRLHAEHRHIEQELGNLLGVANAMWYEGRVAIDQGDFRAARALLEASLKLCRELRNPWNAARALGELGRVAMHQGDDALATAYLAESLTLFTEMENSEWIAVVLKRLGEVVLEQAARVARAQEQPERAARLCGAAEALFVATQEPGRAHCSELECDVAIARAQLDATTWEMAWAEGRAMTSEQAIAYALEEAALPSQAGTRDVQPTSTAVVPPSCPDGAPVALAPREREVLRLVAQGYTDQAVATRLGLRPRTVSSYLSAIYGKLGVRTRTAAAHWLLERPDH
jgi:DNA-binding CsgD family transcriptional regulator